MFLSADRRILCLVLPLLEIDEVLGRTSLFSSFRSRDLPSRSKQLSAASE
jgi:hypothetical protein